MTLIIILIVEEIIYQWIAYIKIFIKNNILKSS